jgi:hypothetical protein
LPGGTPISMVSRQRFMKYPGQENQVLELQVLSG